MSAVRADAGCAGPAGRRAPQLIKSLSRKALLLVWLPVLLSGACAYNGSVQIMGAQPNQRPLTEGEARQLVPGTVADRKSTRLNSSHSS